MHIVKRLQSEVIYCVKLERTAYTERCIAEGLRLQCDIYNSLTLTAITHMATACGIQLTVQCVNVVKSMFTSALAAGCTLQHGHGGQLVEHSGTVMNVFTPQPETKISTQI